MASCFLALLAKLRVLRRGGGGGGGGGDGGGRSVEVGGVQLSLQGYM